MPGRKRGADVEAWLRDLGLERYAPAFLGGGAEALPELTDADLRELGLPLGPRKIALKAIRAMAGPSAPTSGPTEISAEAGPGSAPALPTQAERRQREPLGVVDVFVASETAVDCLAQ